MDEVTDASVGHARTRLLQIGPRLRRTAQLNPSLLAGSIMVGVVVITALLGPLLQRYPAEVPNPLQSLRPPGLQHWFGTDTSGFDVYSRVVAAARVDLLIGLTGTLVAMTIGGIIGIVVGFSKGVADTLVSRGVDLLQSIPLFIAALMFVMLFGQRTSNVIAAMTLR